MDTSTSIFMELLSEAKHSDAFLQMQNSLRDTDINLEKYKYPKRNNAQRKPKEQNIPKLKKTEENEKSGEYGTIFYSWEEVRDFMNKMENALSPTKRIEVANGIRNIKGGDIFYAPQKNTKEEKWKIRPHIVYPERNFKFRDEEGYKVYAIPLDGDHGEKKDSKWYTFLPKYLDYEDKNVTFTAKQESELSEKEKEDLKHKMKDNFYADTGVLRHNIVEGRELYAVRIEDIMNVKSTATSEVMSTLKKTEDKLLKERKNLENSLALKIKNFDPFKWYPSRKEKNTALKDFLGDIYYQYQNKYNLPNEELFSIISKITDKDKFDFIKEEYESWQFYHGIKNL